MVPSNKPGKCEIPPVRLVMLTDHWQNLFFVLIGWLGSSMISAKVFVKSNIFYYSSSVCEKFHPKVFLRKSKEQNQQWTAEAWQNGKKELKGTIGIVNNGVKSGAFSIFLKFLGGVNWSI